jgi:hypothetical protein
MCVSDVTAGQRILDVAVLMMIDCCAILSASLPCSCRYNPETGMLSLSCDRFPTREENRRWCLEVLHRLLQEGQARHPSKGFLLGAAGGAAAQQAAATAALP